MDAKYAKSDGDAVTFGERKSSRPCAGRRGIVIGIVIVLVVALAAGLIIYFAGFHNKTVTSLGQASPEVTTKLPSTTGPLSTAKASPTTTKLSPTTAKLSPTTAKLLPRSPSQAAGLRVDCLIDHLDKTEEECLRRGCGWDDGAADDGDKCSLIMSADSGIVLSEEATTGSTTTLKLSWSGEKKSLFSKPEDIIDLITLEISELSEKVLRITFLDSKDAGRFRVPIPLNTPAANSKPRLYNVTLSGKGEKFSIKVSRKSDGLVIFDTSVADIVMEKQYLSLSTKTPTQNVYGFGENLHKSFKHQFNKTETWAMFARDQPPGQDPNQHYDNLYGVHPFYVCIEDSGKAHGVFLLNSNAQDVTLNPGSMITYRTIGGILDFFIFTGPSANNVVQQYTELVGRPYMPPYWALGFQLCRYGYKNTSDIRAVVERTRNANIPLEIQYADIDYMEARKDFTIDPVHFSELADYFHELRTNHSMKTIIILDPALSIQEGYSIYPEGKAKDIFIKWPSDNRSAICDECTDDQNNMFGYVWPDNKTVFPDFFKSSTKQIWKEWIVNQSAEIAFDGLWIDMNEPANFDTNKDRPWNWDAQRPGEPYWNLKCDMTNPLEKPPYKTKACHIYAGELRNISDKTLCMVAVQGEHGEYAHYDVHNLYGWSQTEPTLTALREAVGNNKRGMVITRSTFAGSGQHAGHWLGDNSANWQHLRESIIGMLEFNLFGIPYVGADICGFFGDTTPQLCKRWMQLGAFYPFSRNHNGIGYVDHDPASFDDETVAELSRSSIETRYRLLPYLYTLFYRANTRGDIVVSSLQFQWPTDKLALDINEQFLWGDAILFSPILYKDQTNVRGYLPEGKWYDWYDMFMSKDSVVSETGKEYIDIQVNETSEIPIHIRGGSIIPAKESALTTTESRRSTFKLIVALDGNGKASGELFWDDGDTIDTTSSSCLVTFAAEDQFLNSTVEKGDCVAGTESINSLTIDTVNILGVTGNTTNVTLAGVDVGFVQQGNSLVVHSLTQLITDMFSIQWL